MKPKETLKPEETIICDFMHNFVRDNWDNIDLKRCEIIEPKETLLSQIKEDIELAMWAMTEMIDWGMNKKGYLKEIYCEVDDKCDFYVIKIDEKYIKFKYNHLFHLYEINFTEPKTKTITYFE